MRDFLHSRETVCQLLWHEILRSNPPQHMFHLKSMVFHTSQTQVQYSNFVLGFSQFYYTLSFVRHLRGMVVQEPQTTTRANTSEDF